MEILLLLLSLLTTVLLLLILVVFIIFIASSVCNIFLLLYHRVFDRDKQYIQQQAMYIRRRYSNSFVITV